MLRKFEQATILLYDFSNYSISKMQSTFMQKCDAKKIDYQQKPTLVQLVEHWTVNPRTSVRFRQVGLFLFMAGNIYIEVYKRTPKEIKN